MKNKKRKTRKQIKSCRYCKNYSIRCKYCYEFGIDISSTRNATHCGKYDEVSESKKNGIRSNSKYKRFCRYRRKYR